MERRTVAEWTAFVACIEAGGGLPRGIKAVGIQRRLLSLLRRSDVEELVVLYERTKSRYQARAAFHVLDALVDARDKRLSSQTLERWRKAVIRRVRRGYPRESGLHLWAGWDLKAACKFLLSFDPTGLDTDDAARYVEDLGRYRQSFPDALERLREVASGKHGETAGGAANLLLKRTAPPTAAELAAKGPAWRRSRRSQVLSWLYYNHICVLSKGSPIDPLLAILGEPDCSASVALVAGGEGRECVWKPADTPDLCWLRLVADDRGILREYKLK